MLHSRTKTTKSHQNFTRAVEAVLCLWIPGSELTRAQHKGLWTSVPKSLKFQFILGFFFFLFAMDCASQANTDMLAQRNSTEALETTLKKLTIKADMLNTKSHGYCPRFSNMANMRACERVSQLLWEMPAKMHLKISVHNMTTIAILLAHLLPAEHKMLWPDIAVCSNLQGSPAISNTTCFTSFR